MIGITLPVFIVAAGVERRLEVEQEKADEAGDYFDEWEWLLAQCGEGDAFWSRQPTSWAVGRSVFACGLVSGKPQRNPDHAATLSEPHPRHSFSFERKHPCGGVEFLACQSTA